MIEFSHTIDPIICDFRFNFTFEKSEDQSIYKYYDKENVVILFILKSNFSQPTMYHCILEWGEYEDYNHYFLTIEEIEEQFNIKL